jgi:hypothetical protein
MKNLFMLFCLFISIHSFAHEGHNNAPGSYKSLHGGTVMGGKELNIEVIINGTELIIYPTSHESKDVAEKNVTISAIAKPKKGKSYPVKLAFSKNGYRATLDLQGANRLPVEITTLSNGKTDHFTVQIEE